MTICMLFSDDWRSGWCSNRVIPQGKTARQRALVPGLAVTSSAAEEFATASLEKA